jgi:hypothetical protein
MPTPFFSEDVASGLVKGDSGAWSGSSSRASPKAVRRSRGGGCLNATWRLHIGEKRTVSAKHGQKIQKSRSSRAEIALGNRGAMTMLEINGRGPKHTCDQASLRRHGCRIVQER